MHLKSVLDYLENKIYIVPNHSSSKIANSALNPVCATINQNSAIFHAISPINQIGEDDNSCYSDKEDIECSRLPVKLQEWIELHCMQNLHDDIGCNPSR